MGCLCLFFDAERRFSAADIDILIMLGRAIAIEEDRWDYQEGLRDFIDIASHELRHPMTVIKGYTSTLKKYLDRMDRDAARSMLGDIEGGVDRLERMVYELLDAARLERGRFSLDMEAVDPGLLAAETLEEARARWPENDFALRAPATLPPVRADEDKLKEVLVILLENAIKYSPQGSPVEVEVKLDAAGGVVLSVLDRGPGVPEKERERIFERFYQAGETRRRPSHGLGLGLYIARRLVEAHGGKIWYEPREGGGSIFRLTLKG